MHLSCLRGLLQLNVLPRGGDPRGDPGDVQSADGAAWRASPWANPSVSPSGRRSSYPRPGGTSLTAWSSGTMSPDWKRRRGG